MKTNFLVKFDFSNLKVKKLSLKTSLFCSKTLLHPILPHCCTRICVAWMENKHVKVDECWRFRLFCSRGLSLSDDPISSEE